VNGDGRVCVASGMPSTPWFRLSNPLLLAPIVPLKAVGKAGIQGRKGLLQLSISPGSRYLRSFGYVL
jgi:hypothetical protein